jgi:hypothetical protein
MKKSKMSRSSTPFTTCRVVSALCALILICLLVFRNHVFSNIDSLRSSVSYPKVSEVLTSTVVGPQTLSSPREFFSFVVEDPTGWAPRRLDDNGGYIETRYNDTLTIKVGISMFHALHCVEIVRGKILANGTEDVHAHHNAQSSLDDDPDARESHVLHCLDYIIQVRSLFSLDLAPLMFEGHNVRRRFDTGASSPAF